MVFTGPAHIQARWSPKVERMEWRQGLNSNKEAICKGDPLAKGKKISILQWNLTENFNDTPEQAPCPGVAYQHRKITGWIFLFICLVFINLLGYRVQEDKISAFLIFFFSKRKKKFYAWGSLFTHLNILWMSQET